MSFRKETGTKKFIHSFIVLCFLLNLLSLYLPKKGFCSDTSSSKGQDANGQGKEKSGLYQGENVDLFAGSSSSSVSIEVPPGRNNLQPSISLNYRSENKSSWVGYGWDLGFGSIVRIGENKKVPTYTSQDEFILGGIGVHSKLIAPDPTNYPDDFKTEYESFLRVSRNTTTNSWTVKAPDGKVYEFGTTADSSIEALLYNQNTATFDRPGGFINTRQWLLNKITDANGNYIEIVYDEDINGGDVYPREIRYAKHVSGDNSLYRVVEFILEARPDVITSYATGSKVREDKRLSKIRVWANQNKTSLIREYRLTYNYLSPDDPLYDPTARENQIKQWTSPHSMLTKVQEFGIDAISNASAQGLPPYMFEYNQKTLGWDYDRPEYHIPSNMNFTYVNQDNPENLYIAGHGVRAVDLNSDGIIDLVRSSAEGSVCYLNDGKGAWTLTSESLPERLDAKFGASTRIYDMNGDFLPDIVRYGDTPVSVTLKRLYWKQQGANTGWGVNDPTWANNLPWQFCYWDSGFFGGTEIDLGVREADFNGDSYVDYMLAKTSGSRMLYLSNKNGTWSNSGWAIPTWFNFARDYGLSEGGVIIDVNNDGLPDLVNSKAGQPQKVLINTGKGFYEDNSYIIPFYFLWSTGDNAWPWDMGVRPVDFNGDGLIDLIKYDQCWINNGNGTWVDTGVHEPEPVVGDNPNPYGLEWDAYADMGVRFFDINADGMDDVIRGYDGRPKTNFYLTTYISKGAFPNLLKKVTIPSGGTIEYEYTPSTRFDNTGADGNVLLPFVRQLVTKVTIDDGLNKANSRRLTTYAYQGGYYDTVNREFRGFRFVQVTDPDGNKQKMWFHQSKELRGNVEKTMTFGSVAPRAPQVISTSPADGEQNVALNVVAQVEFDQEMDPASITPSTVQFIDKATGSTVAQAPGYPKLDIVGTVVSIKPASALEDGNWYQIKVVGGPSGVKSLGGMAMASDYLQPQGFRTAPLAPVVVRTDPFDGEVDVLRDIQPQVFFNTKMDPASITTSTVRLLKKSTGTAVSQAAGYPQLDSTGKIATIKPASILTYATEYQIEVKGGSNGVKSTAGLTMAGDYKQPNGFQVESDPNPCVKPPCFDGFIQNTSSSLLSFKISKTTSQSTFNKSLNNKTSIISSSGQTLSQNSDSNNSLQSSSSSASSYVLLSKTESFYTNSAHPLDSAEPYYNPLRKKVNSLFDSNPVSPRIITETYDYDSYGNMTKYIFWGEGGEGVSDGDEIVIINQYYPNDSTSAYLVNFPGIKSRIFSPQDLNTCAPGWPTNLSLIDSATCWTQQTELSYDNNSSYNQPPTKGNVTQLLLRGNDGTIRQRSFTYDTYGNVLTSTDAQGNTTTYTYNAKANYYPEGAFPYFATNAKGQRSWFDFDQAGNLINAADVNGIATENTYDNYNRLFKSYILKHGASYVNDPPLSEIISEKRITYNNLGNPLTQYIEENNRHSSISMGTFMVFSRSYFDGLSRLRQSVIQGKDSNHDTIIDYLYDTRGLLQKKSFPYFQQNSASQYLEYGYDGVARFNKLTYPDTTSMSQSYDRFTQTFTDAKGIQKVYDYNSKGQLIQVTENNQSQTYTTRYAYDILGKLTQVTDHNNNTITYAYNDLGEQTEFHHPDANIDAQYWVYTYDSVGNLKTAKDPVGYTFTYAYDNLNRLISKSYMTDGYLEEKTYYDGDIDVDNPTPPSGGYGRCIGKVTTQLIKGSGASPWKKNFIYDDSGRLQREEETINSTTIKTSYTYNYDGSINTITYDSGGTNEEIISYSYNYAGQLENISSNSAGQAVNLSDIRYDELNNPTLIVYCYGAFQSFEYYPQTKRLKYIKAGSSYSGNPNSPGTANLQNLYYEYDNNGNITRIQDTNANHSFDRNYTYDDLNRLLTSGQSGDSLTFTYDPLGNLKTLSGQFKPFPQDNNPPPTVNKTYNYKERGYGPHQITSDSDGWYYDYDPNGNLWMKRQGNEIYIYAYDVQNRLVKTSKSFPVDDRTSGTILSVNGYGQGSNRIWRQEYQGDYNNTPASTTLYFGNLYEIKDNVMTKYYFVNSMRYASKKAGKVSFFVSDRMSSSSSIVDYTGTELRYSDYYAFGALKKESGSLTGEDHRYTDQILDSKTNLYYYGARYYDATLSRFLTPDPIGPTLTNPQSLNPYAYVQNNPLKYKDKEGKAIWFLVVPAVWGIVDTVVEYSFTKDKENFDWTGRMVVNVAQSYSSAFAGIAAPFINAGIETGYAAYNGERGTDLAKSFAGHLASELTFYGAGKAYEKVSRDFRNVGHTERQIRYRENERPFSLSSKNMSGLKDELVSKGIGQQSLIVAQDAIEEGIQRVVDADQSTAQSSASTTMGAVPNSGPVHGAEIAAAAQAADAADIEITFTISGNHVTGGNVQANNPAMNNYASQLFWRVANKFDQFYNGFPGSIEYHLDPPSQNYDACP